jgi:hypothetical protein
MSRDLTDGVLVRAGHTCTLIVHFPGWGNLIKREMTVNVNECTMER